MRIRRYEVNIVEEYQRNWNLRARWSVRVTDEQKAGCIIVVDYSQFEGQAQ
jgi:hypothetical protein